MKNIKGIFYAKFNQFLTKLREDDYFYLSSENYYKRMSKLIVLKTKKFIINYNVVHKLNLNNQSKSIYYLIVH